ncbi:Crp/Fnr family transcriptional regulator [Chryseobacterium scophthalmum]|uniref:Crp/Fnr family transcriptional regulator n=1 Tax=Chryseobacterium scophthalmum TaxID=59733 RepID=UPI001AEBD45F|nr:Crp/Fnr family transcriptional regulator [Chryseobacterium scophthalmum]
MEKLVQALSFGGVLSERDIEIVANSFWIKELKSGEYFQESGNTADKIVFVKRGILKVFSTDEKGNDVTKYFIRENRFFADMISYYSAQLAADSIDSVIASKICWISFIVFEKLLHEIPNLLIFFKSVSESTLLNNLKDNDFLNFGSATT